MRKPRSHHYLIQQWNGRQVPSMKMGSARFDGDTIYYRNRPIARILPTGEVLMRGDDIAVYHGWIVHGGSYMSNGESTFYWRVKQEVKGSPSYGWVLENGQQMWKEIKYSQPTRKRYYCIDPAKTPNQAEIKEWAKRIEADLVEYLARRGGWTATQFMTRATKRNIRARELCEKFGLDPKPLYLKELWDRAEKWRSVCLFGGVQKVRKTCRQYGLTDDCPVPELGALLANADELRRNLYASDLRQKYGARKGWEAKA